MSPKYPLLAALLLAFPVATQDNSDRPAATGRVSGLVVDAIGDPIPVTEVWLATWTDQKKKLRRGMTDGDGVFVMGRVPFNKTLYVFSTSKGRMLMGARVYVTSAQPNDTVFLRLWDAADIAGQIVGAKGKPVAGAEVIASFDEARGFGLDPHGVTTTDEKGRFALRKIPLGEINVRAIANGYVMASECIHLQDDARVELQLEKGKGVELRVSVEGLEPKQAQDVRVRVLTYARGSHQALPRRLVRGNLDANGSWSATGLPDFEYRISCKGDGLSFQPRNIKLKPGEGPHRATFRAFADESVLLRGRVVGPDGKPLARESLLCRASNGGRRASAVTNENGEFEIRSPLAPGVECVIYLTRSRYVLAPNPKSDKPSYNWYRAVVDPKKAYELKANRAFAVRGRVVNEKERPVRFQYVLLQKENPPNVWPRWSRAASATTDAEGNFRFIGLQPSETLLRVQFGGRNGSGTSEPFVLPKDAPNGELAGIRLTASKPSSVEGRVRDAAGKPIAGARVWLRNCDERGKQTDGAVFEVVTDRQGRYRHLGVAPGGHYLQVIVRGDDYIQLTTGRPTFVLKPGESAKHELRLQ